MAVQTLTGYLQLPCDVFSLKWQVVRWPKSFVIARGNLATTFGQADANLGDQTNESSP